MRVVFLAEEDIPGLADAGDHVALYLDVRAKPVVRYTQRGWEAVELLADHVGSLRQLPDPPLSPLAVAMLGRLLGEEAPHLSIVED